MIGPQAPAPEPHRTAWETDHDLKLSWLPRDYAPFGRAETSLPGRRSGHSVMWVAGARNLHANCVNYIGRPRPCENPSCGELVSTAKTTLCPANDHPMAPRRTSSAIATRLFPFALCPKNGSMSSDSFQKKDLINEWRLDNPPPCQRGKSLNLWVYGQR